IDTLSKSLLLFALFVLLWAWGMPRALADEPAAGKAFRWPYLATEESAEARGRLIVSKVGPRKMQQRWTIGFETAGRPTEEVLDELGMRLGMKITTDRARGKVAARVEADLRGKCLMEGLETVAAESQCHLEYPVAFGPWGPIFGTIHFEEGPRTMPTAFAGPLLVEVASLEEFAPRGSGTLTLQFRAYGLHPAVFKAFGIIDALELDDVYNADEQSVANLDKQPDAAYSYDEINMHRLVGTAQRELWNLTSGVKSVTAHGGVTVAFPTKVAWGQMKNLKPDAKLNIAGDTMVLESIEQGEPDGGGNAVKKLAIGWRGFFDFPEAAIVALDADNQPLPTYQRKGDRYPQRLAELEVVGEPASVVVKVLQDVDTRSFEFALPGIPLAKADQQPERIDPPKWEGDTPVTVELVIKQEGEDTSKFYRCTNHSDQPIHKIKVAVAFLDADGQQLDSDGSQVDGGSDFSTGEPKVLLPPGETTEIKSGFLLVPKAFDSSSSAVEEVEFLNGRSWKREAAEEGAIEEDNGEFDENATDGDLNEATGEEAMEEDEEAESLDETASDEETDEEEE
ncbi:MAG: hypothetical protein AB7O62_20365, partial [Pirellulales bacterium]